MRRTIETATIVVGVALLAYLLLIYIYPMAVELGITIGSKG